MPIRRKSQHFITVAIAIVVFSSVAVGVIAMRSYNRQMLTSVSTRTQVQTEENQKIADITYLDGTVEVKESTADWSRATVGQELSIGDSIETFSDARAIITLNDGSILRLNQNTKITLVSITEDRFVVSVDHGEIFARVVTSDRIFEIKADMVNYESLQTGFKVSSLENKEGVEVFSTAIKVIDGLAETVVDTGQKYFLKNSNLHPESSQVVLPMTSDYFETDLFTQWNKEEDIKLGYSFFDPSGSEAEDEDIVEEGSATEISLKHFSGGYVRWSSDVQSPQGYAMTWSKILNPTYPIRYGDQFTYFDDPTTISGRIRNFAGSGTYYIRVCEYIDGECGVYSNQVTAYYSEEVVESEEPDVPDPQSEADPPLAEEPELEDPPEPSVQSISLSGGGSIVSWTTVDVFEKGYRVIWSINPLPTYPTRSGDKYKYLSDPGASSASLSAFDGGGTYYVRACEYLAGTCGVYSNQITVELSQ